MEEIAVDIETIESWMCFELCNLTAAQDACDSWYNDASILMFLQAWEEQPRKNVSFESDSDHLDWLAQSEGWDLSGTHPLCFDGVLQTYSYH